MTHERGTPGAPGRAACAGEHEGWRVRFPALASCATRAAEQARQGRDWVLLHSLGLYTRWRVSIPLGD
jgi:hypothetical protein